MLDYVILIISHKNSLFRTLQNSYLQKKISDFPKVKYFYLIGDKDLSSDYLEQDNVIYLKVPDNYESLPQKTYFGLNYVRQKFQDIKGVFKTDDDIEIDLDKLIPFLDDNSHLEYFGLANTFRSGDTSKYHFEKCESDELNKKEQVLPDVSYCSGGGYYLRNSVLDLIIQKKQLFLDNIFEDVAVGIALNSGNIFPVHKPIKGYGAFWENYVSPRWNSKHCTCGRIQYETELFCKDCNKKRTL